MVHVLLEQGASGCVEVETMEVAEEGWDSGENFLAFDELAAGGGFDQDFDATWVTSVTVEDVALEQGIAS